MDPNDDYDMASLGFQDNGDYIADAARGWTSRATDRDIRAIQAALSPSTLTRAMAEDLRGTATDIANSLGMFSERTTWNLSSTLSFLGRLYPGGYVDLVFDLGGEENLGAGFKDCLSMLFPSSQRLSPAEMSIGITHFERVFLGGADEERRAIPQPRDFMDIPYLTLQQYSRALCTSDVVNRIRAVNEKLEEIYK